MQIFNQLLGKIIWAVIVMILLIGGYIYLVKNLVKPPQIVNNQPIPTTPPTPNTNNSNPTVVQSVPDNNADLSGDILPAIAQPDGVIIEAPERLEPGGILKVYTNNNGAEYPDPLNYSPSKVIKTNGLSMVNVEKESRKFQEASGYFLVPETGDYNFVVELPESYKDVEIGSLNVKVDGIVLSSPDGGEIYLEQGYHQISLLNSYSVKGDYPTINWAATGEEVKPLKVFREVEE
ncbi:MAG: hypothetical protein QNJ72_23880 [Pleurocapsa sp. MO_226.B13]|nr:hypothetical protein [Pleurocapsa sp. MO_226.B13]